MSFIYFILTCLAIALLCAKSGAPFPTDNSNIFIIIAILSAGEAIRGKIKGD